MMFDDHFSACNLDRNKPVHRRATSLPPPTPPKLSKTVQLYFEELYAIVHVLGENSQEAIGSMWAMIRRSLCSLQPIACDL
ncbi:hypothetical protein [Sodalis-like endosymbiont of Proechinophthirus fluctus]|uniref:hypothetical protein n=1 Tax=Sodalis-like endosymbiont of Proechinophthirus fluctus TaxID=1462730 RepID=UPI0034E956CE